MKADITVLMSVYNNERTVGKSIESILWQTYPHFVFVIINDGSTDNSSSQIRKFSDKRIVYIDKNKNLGLTRRLNEQLDNVSTHYVARMDADDISRPDRLEKQHNFMTTHQSYGAVGSNFKRVNAQGSLLWESDFPLSSKDIRQRILLKNPFKHSILFFRTEILKTLGGYNEKFKYSQDYDLMLRLTAKYPVANLKECLLVDNHIDSALSQTHRFDQAKFATLAQINALRRGDYPLFQSVFLFRSLGYLFKSWLS